MIKLAQYGTVERIDGLRCEWLKNAVLITVSTVLNINLHLNICHKRLQTQYRLLFRYQLLLFLYSQRFLTMRLDLMGERKVKDSNLHAFISQCDATRARKVFSFSFIVHGCELAAVSNLAFATHIFFPARASRLSLLLLGPTVTRSPITLLSVCIIHSSISGRGNRGRRFTFYLALLTC